MYMMSTQPFDVMLWNTTRHAEKIVSKFVMPQLKASTLAFLSVPSHRKQSGAYSAQVVEAPDEEDEGEHVLEENEASDDELEAEYQEAVTLMTTAKQHRAEVDPNETAFAKTVLAKTSVILKIARPELTSSNRDFHVRNVVNWTIGKTTMIALPK